MRYLLIFWALACLSASAAAQGAAEELARRSGLSLSEVEALLADCDANQSSMNFCAWRDQIAAEQDLQRVLDEQSAAAPECKAAQERKIARWKQRRDAQCAASARKDWGGGSFEPTARAMCVADATKRMTRAVATQPCNPHPKQQPRANAPAS